MLVDLASRLRGQVQDNARFAQLAQVGGGLDHAGQLDGRHAAAQAINPGVWRQGIGVTDVAIQVDGLRPGLDGSCVGGGIAETAFHYATLHGIISGLRWLRHILITHRLLIYVIVDATAIRQAA
jgi:hypothetical protein